MLSVPVRSTLACGLTLLALTCRCRLALLAPRHARALRRVRFRLVDRWGLGGFAARVCIEPPGGPARCRKVRVRTRPRSTSSSFVLDEDHTDLHAMVTPPLSFSVQLAAAYDSETDEFDGVDVISAND